MQLDKERGVDDLTHRYELAIACKQRSLGQYADCCQSSLLYQLFLRGYPLVSRTPCSKAVSSEIVNMSKLLLCLVVSALAGPLPEEQGVAETK